jgi:membrane fusion protein, copper/silver efflux system
MKKENINKIAVYTAFIVAGLFLGWLLFGRSTTEHLDYIEPELAEAEDIEYTCSMHPQIRQDQPGDCPICGMDLIPVSDGDDQQEDDPYLFTMQASQANWANVRTMIAGLAEAGGSLRLTGRVAVNEKERRVITAHFPGRIENLYADFTGRYVQRGERLATLYSPEMMQAQQELIQAFATREDQPRLYNSARQRLKLFNITDQQIDNIVQGEQASPTLDIFATQSGFLTERSVSEGDYVNTGQELFAIASLNNIWVELDAYENQVALIQDGQQAIVEIPAQAGNKYPAKVEFIDPFLDPETRSASVRLTVNNRDNALKPGMLVTATIITQTRDELVIPTTAVLWTGDRSVVYVKDQQSEGFTFEFREIETGARTEDGYLIKSGLSAGEEIAVNGVFAIDAAAQLRGHYSMMAPPEKTSLPEGFKKNLESLFNSYFDLKNALTEDAPEPARRHGQELLEQLNQTGIHSLEGEHHAFWMQQYELIEEHATAFTTAQNIEEMRMHFEPLSAAFIETARTLGAVGQNFYVSFCPMVDGDRGAYWLSEVQEIINPYFGSMMLNCGEVREVIREDVGNNKQREPQAMEGHVH